MAFVSSGYNPEKPMEGRISDIGPRKYDSFFPKSSRRTSANGCTTKSWNPACSCTSPESGDKVYTVRCGGTRTMSVTNIREICEIADQVLRWTRSLDDP